MTPIRKGDGTGLSVPGYSQVRKGDGTVVWSAGSDIPDSVVHQYDFINNWSQGDTTVADSVGSADMSLTGDPQDATIGGESGAEGDGSDDYGSANGPETLPQNQSFGLAFTFSASGIGSQAAYYGSERASNTDRMYLYSGQSGSAGDIQIDLADSNENFLRVHTDNTYDDGTAKTVVINKTGNTASEINIYVDDMSTPVATTTAIDDPFDNTNYGNTEDLAAFARNSVGTIQNYMNVIFGVLEFNTSPYSQSERDDFVGRRPEV